MHQILKILPLLAVFVLSAYDPLAENPIIIAIRNYDHISLTKLIASGKEIDIKARNGDTSLITSIKFNNLSAFNALIKANININSPDNNKKSPISWSIITSNSIMFLRLITEKALTNIQDDDGNTPLMHATTIGSLPFVEKLLASDALTSTRNFKGQSALDIANSKNFNTIASLIAYFE